jgi:hypothetical protein
MKQLVDMSCVLVGVLLLSIGSYRTVNDIRFLFNGSSLEATIIEVRHESVPAGRGSNFAYVPVVEIPGVGAVKVNTYGDKNVFAVGSRMSVVCDISARSCISNAFLEKWWGLVVLAGGLMFFVPPIVSLIRKRKTEALRELISGKQ